MSRRTTTIKRTVIAVAGTSFFFLLALGFLPAALVPQPIGWAYLIAVTPVVAWTESWMPCDHVSTASAISPDQRSIAIVEIVGCGGALSSDTNYYVVLKANDVTVAASDADRVLEAPANGQTFFLHWTNDHRLDIIMLGRGPPFAMKKKKWRGISITAAREGFEPPQPKAEIFDP